MAIKSIIEAIPSAHRHRFATASDIRKTGANPLHPALTIQNFDNNFQARVRDEITEKRMPLLGDYIKLPQCIGPLGGGNNNNSNVLAENFSNFKETSSKCITDYLTRNSPPHLLLK